MITAKKLNKAFGPGKKAVHAVKDASMSIQKGERLYIHGPSGAGKSTLLHMLGGLARPSSGEVRFGDTRVYKLSDRKRSRLRNGRFGFIFQFYHLLPELSVLRNVMLPAMIKSEESYKSIKARATELLETVNMGKRLKHRPNQLSGGEAQRTAIARALINSPEALFCDEPTGNLDSEMSDQIYRLLLDISEKKEMSIVVVSHQGIIEGFFHSKYFMKDGVLEKVLDRSDQPLEGERIIHGN